MSGSLTGHVYFLQGAVSRNVKIGHTSGPVRVRISALQVGCPEELVLLADAPGSPEDEERLHDLFASHRVRGEWFSPVEAILELTAELSLGNVTLRDYLDGAG